LRILHIWDQAGVACTLAKYQRLIGHESSVLVMNGVDKYGIYDFYKNCCTKLDPSEFLRSSLSETESADVIHIHSRSDIFIEVYRKFRKSKKIILQYHGTDVRGFKGNTLRGMDPGRKLFARTRRAISKIRKRYHLLKLGYLRSASTEAQKISDTTLVSTPDLLSLVIGGVYLPVPIDTDHFKNYGRRTEQEKAIFINTEVTDTSQALGYCKSSSSIDLDIEVYDRTNKPIMFKDMPKFLNNYDVYVDIRYVDIRILENLSKTALESLACGLRVLDHGLKFRVSVPEEHLPMKVVSSLSKLYSR
jgi:hypothetical protein